MRQIPSASEFGEQLNHANRLYQALRPDVVTLMVSGYQCYLTDPRGGITDEPPPRMLTKDSELITIDEYLGIYIPSDRQIKIFKANIITAAEMLSCEEEDLAYIVRFHEHAHAAIHLGVTGGERTQGILNAKHARSQFQSLTKVFVGIEAFLQEQLAQLVTYHVLRMLCDTSQEEAVCEAAHRMLDVFSSLMRRQPSAYRVEPHLEVSLERLRGSIHLIRKGHLVGKLDPWSEIMSWK